MNFVITKEDAQKIMDYLVQKPFIEVQSLVAILAQLKKADIAALQVE